MQIEQKYTIKTVYVCAYCSEEFDWFIDCVKHEEDCTFKKLGNFWSNMKASRNMWFYEGKKEDEK